MKLFFESLYIMYTNKNFQLTFTLFLSFIRGKKLTSGLLNLSIVLFTLHFYSDYFGIFLAKITRIKVSPKVVEYIIKRALALMLRVIYAYETNSFVCLIWKFLKSNVENLTGANPQSNIFPVLFGSNQYNRLRTYRVKSLSLNSKATIQSDLSGLQLQRAKNAFRFHAARCASQIK